MSEQRGLTASTAHWDFQRLAGQALLVTRRVGRREVLTVPVDLSKRLPAV